ncbi:MAG: radical SAM protein [Theionarchaea archaeon]|nr:radical SAM protein [Theionarchaea archaeon]
MPSEKEFLVSSGSLVIKKQKGGSYLVKDLKQRIQGKGNEDLKELLVMCDGTRTEDDVVRELCRLYSEPEKEVGKKASKSIAFLRDLHFLGSSHEPLHTPVIVRDSDMEWPVDVAYLEVTNACNLKCVHCYKEAGVPRGEELGTEDWVSLIDELASLGVVSIAVTGGEPLLREDIFDILECIVDNVIGLNLFTNGTLLTEDTVSRLKDLNPEKVMVSVDGMKETHQKIRGENTYDRTLKGITRLINDGIPVRSNTVVHSENVGELSDIIQVLVDLGVREMVFDQFMEAGRGREHGNLIPALEMGEKVSQQCRAFEEKTPQRIELKFTSEMQNTESSYSFCGVGTSMLTVTAYGDVVLCPVLSSPEHTAGNLKDESLESLWMNSPVFDPFRQCTPENMVCGTCPHVTECRGGCKARVLHYYNKVCMPDPWMCATRGQPWPEQPVPQST